MEAGRTLGFTMLAAFTFFANAPQGPLDLGSYLILSLIFGRLFARVVKERTTRKPS